MPKTTTKRESGPVNLYLSADVRRAGAKVAYQFHGEASLSELVEKLLKREIARRERRTQQAAA